MGAESQEYAERPKEGELWREMIERQLLEGNPENGYSRERLRSLPQEQQQDKEKERGGMESPYEMAAMQSYESMLNEASQRGGQEQRQELER